MYSTYNKTRGTIMTIYLYLQHWFIIAYKVRTKFQQLTYFRLYKLSSIYKKYLASFQRPG